MKILLSIIIQHKLCWPSPYLVTSSSLDSPELRWCRRSRIYLFQQVHSLLLVCIVNTTESKQNAFYELKIINLKNHFMRIIQFGTIQAFHNLGRRNGILYFLLLSEVWKLDLAKLVWPARTVWKYLLDWLVTKYDTVCSAKR